jgi:N-acetylglucosaminyldiphosphoundecaprenol N-acetyl-beta-D-mannosaminyltransferase
MLKKDSPHLIASVNPEICMAAANNPELREFLLAANLGLPDGIGIVLASRLRGGSIRQRITGIDFMQALVGLAAREGKTIFLFGAAEGVAEAAADNLCRQFPGLKVAGTHHGYLPSEQESDVARIILSSGADMVFVGLGSPRQELFLAAHGKATGARVLMVVGGSFDVLAGRLQRAPEIYQKLGLEWLYRLLQQPSRIKRFLALPKFLPLVIIKKN